MLMEATGLSEPELFAKNKYLSVKGMIPINICDVAAQYALFHRHNFFRPESERQMVPGTHGIYGDLLMETLLKFTRPHLERRIGFETIPTYSYFRIYKPGDELKRHKDRPACEISLSVTLGYDYIGVGPDYEWPIFIGDSDGSIGTKGRAFACKPGDCIIYRGCELEHWREPFDAKEGSFQVQVFLHYVDANGPYARLCPFDRRPGIGFPPAPKGT